MGESAEVTEKQKKTPVHVCMYLVCPLLFELVEFLLRAGYGSHNEYTMMLGWDMSQHIGICFTLDKCK